MRRWNLWLSLSLALSFVAVPLTLRAEDDGDDAATKPAEVKQPRKRSAEETYELYKAFADTLDQIERNYVKEVDRRELMEAAIRGMVGKLDPYSNFIPSDDFGSFKSSVESQFGGLGIQVTVDDGQLRVLSPIVGTPAYRAGIQSGDRITEIEGESTRGLRIDEAVRKLKGEAGTSVTITVYHPGTKESEKVTLKREVVHVSTILGDTHKPDDAWEYMLDNDSKLGYIRMTSFSRETTEELKKALEELKSRKMRGLILDLRNNPGGLLTAAVDISDLFVADGKIVSTKGRNTPERVWEAKKDGKYEDFPMAVLVNHYSASASEILAACLQDNKRAVVIGERTWGKGSVQNVIELEDGKSALKLTTASYQRPNGHNIHRFPDSKDSDEWGVKPNDDYEVKLTDGELTKLLDQRRRRDHLAPKTNPKEEDKHEVVADPQLEKAIKYLSGELARVDEPKKEEAKNEEQK